MRGRIRMIVTIKSDITGKDYIAHTDEELTKCLKQMNEDDALYKKAHEQEDAEYEGVTNLYNAYTKALERYDSAKKEVQKILEESNAKMQEIISSNLSPWGEISNCAASVSSFTCLLKRKI